MGKNVWVSPGVARDKAPAATRALAKALLVDPAEPATAAAMPIRLWAAGLLPQDPVFPGNESGDHAAIAVVERQHAPLIAFNEMDFRSRDADAETLASAITSVERVFATALALQRPFNYGFLVVTSHRFGYLSLDEPRGQWIAVRPLADIIAVTVRRRLTGVRLSIVTSSETVESWKLASTSDAYRIALRLRFVQKMYGSSRETTREALRRDVELAVIEGVMSAEDGDRALRALETDD